MVKTRTLSIAFTSALAILLVIPAYANQLRLEEGATLYYKWARVSSGTGGLETGNATFTILAFNQTTLIARVAAKQSLDLKIEYENGIPVYADYLEGLIYLPPNCIVQSLQGNLNWTTNIKTETKATVINGTIQTQNFSTDAGVFQCINLTLNLAGWEFGNLTLIYDLNSGVLVYEQWIPEYGDIIIHTLITYPTNPWSLLSTLLLPTATFIIPVAITIHQIPKILKKGKYKHTQQETKSGLPLKFFFTLVIAALLILASTIFPWSQLAELQIYLPSSLTSFLIQSTEFLTSTSNFVIISIAVHTAAILAWLSIAIHMYMNKKLIAQLITTSSSILALISVILFFQTGWTPSWGLPLTVSGAIIAITSTAFTNIKDGKKTFSSSTTHITSPRNK